jgi:hypothetical protein
MQLIFKISNFLMLYLFKKISASYTRKCAYVFEIGGYFKFTLTFLYKKTTKLNSQPHSLNDSFVMLF